MRGARKSKSVFFAVLLLASVIFVAGPASADWALYDDFSSPGLDSSKWSHYEVHPDVTWTVSNGKLLITKVAGATPVERNSRLRPINLPAGANGIKADVRVRSFSDHNIDVKFKFEYGSGTFNFGTGVVNAVRAASFKLLKVSQNSFSARSYTEIANENNFDQYNTMAVVNPFLNDIESKQDVNFALVHSQKFTRVEIKPVERKHSNITLVTFSNESAMRNSMAQFRVQVAEALSSFVIEVDNVYVHTGEYTDTEQTGKVVVVPLM